MAKQIKCLLETLQQTINEVRNKNEIAIIENYGNKGKRLTKIFICKIKFIKFLYLLLCEVNCNKTEKLNNVIEYIVQH